MIAVLVLTVAAVVGVALVGWERRPGAHPLDTEVEERWLITHAPACLRPALRVVDRRVAGGVMVAASFVTVVGAAATVGWLLDSVDAGSGFARWDSAAAQFGADHGSASSTVMLRVVTQLGATPVLVLAAMLVGASAWRARGAGPALYLGAVVCGVVAVNNALKVLIDRERPDVDRLVAAAGTSFPSGHTATAAAGWVAVAVVLVRSRGRRTRAAAAAVAVAVAVAVAASRVLLGVHWLTDTLAGLVVGWSWVGLVTVAFGGRLLRLGATLDRV